MTIDISSILCFLGFVFFGMFAWVFAAAAFDSDKNGWEPLWSIVCLMVAIACLQGTEFGSELIEKIEQTEVRW
jgi:hypothetical protein